MMTLLFVICVQAMKLEAALFAPHFLKAKQIGFIEIGLGVENAPQSLHWTDMIANQRHAIARWHRLSNPDHDS